MKGREIIAEMRSVKAALANIRGWCDAVDAHADKVIEALAQPIEVRQTQPETADPYPPDPFGVEPTDDRDAPGLAVEFDGDPIAPSLATLITPKQLGMIRALARECGVDYEVECQEQLGCKPEELGKRAASAFIDYLKRLQERGAEFKRAS